MNYKVTILCSALALSMSCYSINSMAKKGGVPGGFGPPGHVKSKGIAKGGKNFVGTPSKGQSVGIGKLPARSITGARFSPNDRTVIYDYFRTRKYPVTALPPGIAKNVLLGKPLPPGIAKQYLPNDLLRLLPRYSGYDYYVIGRDAVLVNSTTGLVVDVLSNILLH